MAQNAGTVSWSNAIGQIGQAYARESHPDLPGADGNSA